MNNKLSNLNTVNVSTYISDIKPGTQQLNTKGSLIVCDNSEGNNNDISSYYGFYIDDVFIAGGYGFKSLQDYKDYLKKTDKIKDINDKVEELEEIISQQDFKFNFTYTGDSNIMSPEYNTYGFICSYKFFKLSYVNNSYTFNLSNNVNVNYVNNIDITPITEDLNYEDNNRFEYQITYNYIGNTHIKYNDDIKIYVNSQVINENPKTLYLDKPQNKYSENLSLSIKNKRGEEIYSYNIPEFAKWKGSLNFVPDRINLPINYGVKYGSSNYVNFRDTNFDWDNSDETKHAQIENLLELIEESKGTNKLKFEFEKEIPIVFNCGDSVLYDYIIMNQDYYIEFWFNGIKSYNWNKKKHGNDYIYQSPQQYSGEHTWVIKIYPTNN